MENVSHMSMHLNEYKQVQIDLYFHPDRFESLGQRHHSGRSPLTKESGRRALIARCHGPIGYQVVLSGYEDREEKNERKVTLL